MGIIQRQTLKNNLLAYGAVAVGAFAQLKIYPEDLELKGHADGLLKIALLLFPLFTFGMSMVMVRFLPYLEGEMERAMGQLLSRGLVVVTIGLAALAAFNYLFGDWIINSLLASDWKVGKLEHYRWQILGLTAAMVYTSIITAHLTNYKRIAIPVLFNNLLLKIGLIIIFLLAINSYFSLQSFTTMLVVLYFLAAFGLIAYATYLGIFRLRWGRLTMQDKSRRDMISLAVFGIFGSVGSVLATHLDTIFINTLISDQQTGVYSFAIFTTMVIGIPYKAVNSIASPIVADRWKHGDVDQLGFLYRESATVLYAAGGLIFTGAVVCLPYLYQLTEKTGQLSVGYVAVLLLGAGQLFDQLTSINSSLVSFTDYYRWNIVFLLVMGAMNAVLNYYFIAVVGLGLTGAALATMLSLCLYNLAKGIFIYWKMGLQPLSLNQLYTSLVLTASGLLAWFAPGPTGVIPNILLRGSLIVLFFLLYLRYTNGVPPIRRMLKGGIKAMF